MSSEIPSQDQFDGDTEPDDAGDAGPNQEVQVYDFQHPARISKDRKRSLTAIYGLLTKSFESWVTGRVRDQIEFQLESVEQFSFGEFTLALPRLCASYIVTVSGTGQQGVIDFGHEFGYFIIDRLLGGSADHVVPERPFTQTERLVVRIVAERAASQLSHVWKDHVRLDLEVDGFESLPEMLQVANREDPVLVAYIGVTMGSVTSRISLCLPFAVLEKYFIGTSERPYQVTKGTDEERSADHRWAEISVLGARVPVGARLPTFRLPLKTLASIKPGGVLPTGLSPESDLEINVAGQKRFRGTPGRLGQSLAVEITGAATPEPENVMGLRRTRT